MLKKVIRGISVALFGLSFSVAFAAGGDINLDNTTASNISGVIYKGLSPFIHNFNYGDNGTIKTKGKNVFVGEDAGNFTMGSTATSFNDASKNIGIGYQSLRKNTTGSGNTAIGFQSLFENTSGSNNVGLSTFSLQKNTTGSHNIASGHSALKRNETGSQNIAIGQAALSSNLQGNANVAIGQEALYRNMAGDANIGIGLKAGYHIADGSGSNRRSHNSIFIGQNSAPLANGEENQIVIGYNAVGAGSDSAVLGNDRIKTTLLKGQVGVGTATPKTELEVDGVIKTVPTTSRICNDDSEGGIMYDSDDKHFYGCNGTSWVQLDK